jgi:hypothetical protein
MARMKPCKICSKEVAKSAKVCPHCGAKLKMGFFKKALFGLAALILIIVLISVASGGKNENTTTQTSTTNTEVTPPAELSKEGISSDVKIVVESSETKDQVGDNQFINQQAQGVFKIIKLNITNNQKDAVTIDSNSFTLIDDKNREFSYSSEAQTALEMSLKDNKESFFLKSLNPGLSVSGYVVFDVPKDAKGFVLQAQGGMMGKKIKLKVE